MIWRCVSRASTRACACPRLHARVPSTRPSVRPAGLAAAAGGGHWDAAGGGWDAARPYAPEWGPSSRRAPRRVAGARAGGAPCLRGSPCSTCSAPPSGVAFRPRVLARGWLVGARLRACNSAAGRRWEGSTCDDSSSTPGRWVRAPFRVWRSPKSPLRGHFPCASTQDMVVDLFGAVARSDARCQASRMLIATRVSCWLFFPQVSRR